MLSYQGPRPTRRRRGSAGTRPRRSRRPCSRRARRRSTSRSTSTSAAPTPSCCRSPACLYLAGGDRYGSGLPAGEQAEPRVRLLRLRHLRRGVLRRLGPRTPSSRDVAGEAVRHRRRLAMRSWTGAPIGAGVIKSDREVWDLMVETIARLGYEGKVGLQIDCAAAQLLPQGQATTTRASSSPASKTRDQMIDCYAEMVKDYPFVILEDPLDEDDYEGHAILTRELGIQITGDDLFTTNPARVAAGHRGRRREPRAAQGEPDRHDHRGVRDGPARLPQRLRRAAVLEPRRGRGHRRLHRRADVRHGPQAARSATPATASSRSRPSSARGRSSSARRASRAGEVRGDQRAAVRGPMTDPRDGRGERRRRSDPQPRDADLARKPRRPAGRGRASSRRASRPPTPTAASWTWSASRGVASSSGRPDLTPVGDPRGRGGRSTSTLSGASSSSARARASSAPRAPSRTCSATASRAAT